MRGISEGKEAGVPVLTDFSSSLSATNYTSLRDSFESLHNKQTQSLRAQGLVNATDTTPSLGHVSRLSRVESFAQSHSCKTRNRNRVNSRTCHF